MAESELYDIDKSLRELSRARLRKDPLIRETCALGDRLAEHLTRHFAAEELETAGRAVLVASASMAGLLAEMEALPPQVILNMLGFASQRLITDGRAWSEETEVAR